MVRLQYQQWTTVDSVLDAHSRCVPLRCLDLSRSSQDRGGPQSSHRAVALSGPLIANIRVFSICDVEDRLTLEFVTVRVSLLLFSPVYLLYSLCYYVSVELS